MSIDLTLETFDKLNETPNSCTNEQQVSLDRMVCATLQLNK